MTFYAILKETDCGSNDGSSVRSKTFQTGKTNPKRGASTYSLGNFPEKLDEIENVEPKVVVKKIYMVFVDLSILWSFKVREGVTSLYRMKTI